MAFRVITDLLRDSRDATPHEMNRELEAYIGEFNGGLDRENFLASFFTRDRLARGALNDPRFLEFVVPISQSLDSATSSGTPIPVPGALATTRLAIPTATPDCALEIEGNASYLGLLGHTRLGIALAIHVDGERRAISGCSFWRNSASRDVQAVVAVGAGTHTIELMWHPAFGFILGDVTIQWNARSLWVRQVHC